MPQRLGFAVTVLAADCSLRHLRTLSYRCHFDATVIESVCQTCGAHDKTIAHIVLQCVVLNSTFTQFSGACPQGPLAPSHAFAFSGCTHERYQAIDTGRDGQANNPNAQWYSQTGGLLRPQNDFWMAGAEKYISGGTKLPMDPRIVYGHRLSPPVTKELAVTSSSSSIWLIAT